MNGSWRTTLTLLLLAGAVLSGWSVWTHRKGAQPQDASGARSDYVLHDFELIALDDAGKESFTLRAPELKREPGRQSMALETPLFLLPDSEQKYGQIRAKTGWVSADGKELKLRGDVVTTSPPQASQPVTMNTEQLNIYPDTHRTTSPSLVTITQPGLTMHGRGMQGDLAAKRFTLLSQTRTRYAPSRR
jgi:lipopolysaccharide export system protein LptC